MGWAEKEYNRLRKQAIERNMDNDPQNGSIYDDDEIEIEEYFDDIIPDQGDEK